MPAVLTAWRSWLVLPLLVRHHGGYGHDGRALHLDEASHGLVPGLAHNLSLLELVPDLNQCN